LLQALIQIAGGFILLVWGADRLVAGAASAARNIGVSPLIVGLTIIGFGTSAPELVVSAIAAAQGSPALAVGNALGSNIANIGLVLGLTAIVYPLRVESKILKREFPVLMLIMVAVTWLMFDLELDRSDGILLLCGLLAMLGSMVYLGLQRQDSDPLIQEYEAEIPSDMPTSTAVLWLVTGLIVLPISSSVLVDGSISIARILGVSDAVIGLTIVALGTSLPELAAALSAAVKHEDEIAIGNVIGSNMFNLLGVLGIAATITPVSIHPDLIHRDSVAMYVFTLLLFLLAWGIRGPGRIRRRAGVLLLIMYLTYQAIVIAGALT
jgi:cation:H+ antiporter